MIDPQLAGGIGTLLVGGITALWCRCVVLEDRSRADALLMQQTVQALTEALREQNRKAG